MSKSTIDVRELNEYDMKDYGAELTRLFNYLHDSQNMRLAEWLTWLKAQGHVYGAFDNDKLVGMATALLIPKPYGSPKNFVVQLEDVAVMENRRSEGIGSKLIKHIERLAKFHGWGYKIILCSNDKNIPFYNKLGYSVRANNMRKDL